MATLALEWCVLCALTAGKPAPGHGHGHGRKAEKIILARTKAQAQERLLLFWMGCVCAPWACYMNLRALCVSKLAKCPLICPGDLVGDRGVGCVCCLHAQVCVRVSLGDVFCVVFYGYISFFEMRALSCLAS
jgi:hypothetical protein